MQEKNKKTPETLYSYFELGFHVMQLFSQTILKENKNYSHKPLDDIIKNFISLIDEKLSLLNIKFVIKPEEIDYTLRERISALFVEPLLNQKNNAFFLGSRLMIWAFLLHSNSLDNDDSHLRMDIELDLKALEINDSNITNMLYIEKNQFNSEEDFSKAVNDNLHYINRIIEMNLSKIKINSSDIESSKWNEENRNKEYDFFISHASEDKEPIAEPLAKALIQKGASVWYDKFAMKIGDSLRSSIDLGLAHSKHGIVILSEHYFKKNWSVAELNGLFSKQMNNSNVILPIWYNISKKEIENYSPILADIVALKSEDYTIEELANELMNIL